MNSDPRRHLAIPGTYNVRDLGGYDTPAGQTAWRRVLRADGLHRLDSSGMVQLRKLGVTTVIDLRHAGEIASRPNPFAAKTATSVAYHNISLFEQLAPSPRADIDVLGDLYRRALDTRGDAIARVLELIAAAPDGVVLFHCTAGKDRTGIISALLLLIGGVAAETVVGDYVLTGPMIAPMIEEIVKDAVERGADIEAFRRLLTSDASTMASMIEHLQTSYASAHDYARHIGLSAQTIARIQRRLGTEARS